MAFVRLLKDLMRDKEFGQRIVPIIPDEARTFGMDAFFPNAKIYNPNGQNYTSVDRELMLAYKESPQGQILHVGINEAGSIAAFTAVGTSYATHGEPMIPIYVFYSMFGFQRTGDSIWAAGDQMARGFIIGATAGRTTLTGEGLQHADGHSPLLASTNPAVVSLRPGLRLRDRPHRADGPRPDVRRRRTPTRTSSTTSPSTTSRSCSRPSPRTSTSRASCAASTCSPDVDGCTGPQGPAARLRRRRCRGRSRPRSCSPTDWGVSADVWSVTSWNELRRDGLAADEHNFLHPEAERAVPYVTQKLPGAAGPFVAVSDYMRAVPDQIRAVRARRRSRRSAPTGSASPTPAPAARRFFHIDGPSVVVRALQLLAERGEVDRCAPGAGRSRSTACTT